MRKRFSKDIGSLLGRIMQHQEQPPSIELQGKRARLLNIPAQSNPAIAHDDPTKGTEMPDVTAEMLKDATAKRNRIQ